MLARNPYQDPAMKPILLVAGLFCAAAALAADSPDARVLSSGLYVLAGGHG